MADISGYLQNIRNGARGEDVRDSIINALDKINKDNPAVIRPLNVTANGTYAGEGGVVYNPVTVNVPEGASQALSLTDIKITENGEFEPDDGAAYRNITVEVPTYVNEIMTDEKVVYLEEGDKVYYALDDGYDGYSAVHVMSGGSGGGGGATYYVDFLNTDGSLLERVTNVPFGGGAVYHKPLPTSPGMRFVGWNPNPLNVKSNMEVVARFENLSYDPNQITDDWLTIAKKCQADPNAYNIGQWKLLELNPLAVADMDELSLAVTTINGNPTPFEKTYLRMVLVGKGVDQIEGENGYANTTWFSVDILRNQLNYFTSLDLSTDYSWVTSSIRAFYQGQFTTNIFPQELIQYVKRITKKSAIVDEIPTRHTAFPSTEWLWIPSLREMIGNCQNMSGHVIGELESEGPIYDYFCNYEQDFDYENSAVKRQFKVYGGSNNQAIYTRTNATHQVYGSWRTLAYINNLGKEADDQATPGIFMCPTLGFCL